MFCAVLISQGSLTAPWTENRGGDGVFGVRQAGVASEDTETSVTVYSPTGRAHCFGELAGGTASHSPWRPEERLLSGEAGNLIFSF